MSDDPLDNENDEKDMQCDNQPPQDPVQVFCRLRPIPEEAELTNIKLLSPTTLSLVTESKVSRKECNYVFSHIFTSYSSQREVFEHVTLALLEDLIQGKNGILFTYGVTGSGKTYTLSGDQSTPGVMPRSIDTIFNSIGEQQTQKFLVKTDRLNGFEVQTDNDALGDRLVDAKSSKRLRTCKSRTFYVNDGTKLNSVNPNSLYTVFISYVEIYNNTIYDLLDESTGKVLQAKIIREDWQKNMYVNGVVELEVKSSAEAFELFFLGQKRKRMAQTTLNTESSRSHSVFNIRIVQLEKGNLLKVGQLSLVDLAGSERCSRAQTTGLRLKEASSINNSLMSLRTCLQILRENQLNAGNKLVPYRDSRLTLLFKSYFEGEGQVRMIVCVNPSDRDSEENLQVLKFAEMTQDVKIPRAESRYTPYRKTPKPARHIQNTPIVKAKKTVFHNGMPKLPNLILSMEEPEHNLVVLENLQKILTVHKEKNTTNKPEVRKKEDHFRKRLVQIHQDNVLSTCEVRSLKVMFKKQKENSDKLEGKITDLELANDALAKNNEELQGVIHALQNTVDEKNLKLNQNQLERERNRQKQALHTQKMSEELEEKLRKQRAMLNSAMQAKDAKIRKVKEILDSDTISITSQTQHQLPAEMLPLQEENIEAAINQSVSVLRHPRGRGVGEVWLEHNAVKPVPLSTVLQPSIKKRKSLSKLKKATDITNPKQNKYCLIAQEPDREGDTETKVYKADIVRTCGGGAQVIFNDVECLRQESPTRERPMSPTRN